MRGASYAGYRLGGANDPGLLLDLRGGMGRVLHADVPPAEIPRRSFGEEAGGIVRGVPAPGAGAVSSFFGKLRIFHRLDVIEEGLAAIECKLGMGKCGGGK